MDQDNQSDQEQKKQSGGGFNPINTFNNLMDIRRGFGKKAATQAGETAAKAAGKTAAQAAGKAALSNPYVLAALGMIILLVIVFAIVASGAAPGAPAMETGSINTQTEVPTPTLLPGP
ncbi:MAG: hypothetical protein US59_C0038G0009 [Candidatus Levybacteria bacterium GW2011_GWB1_37_8]|nr:MAG: hypothetical protein US59_C0038G0009 [Candidatus Levybacteria bacterium GW2011_GWB1_37_8]